MKVVLNRALSLATRGVLGGSAIALATHGLIQMPQTVDIPVIELPAYATGGGASVYGDVFLAVPQHLTYVADIQLLLKSQTLAKLKQPFEIIKTAPTGLRAFYDAHGELKIVSESEWSHYDWQESDDEDVLLLVAAYLATEDESYRWNEPYDF